MAARAHRGLAARLAQLVVGLVLGVALVFPPPAAHVAGASSGDAQIVAGQAFEPAALQAPESKARHIKAPRARLIRPGRISTDGVVGTRLKSRATIAPMDLGAAAVQSGLFAYHTNFPAWGLYDGNGAILGNQLVVGTDQSVYADYATPSTPSSIWNWDNGTFFGLPATDAYFGSAVTASMLKNRFVAVLPTVNFDTCSTGYINIAVSKNSDPMQPWTRYQISIGDAWTDAINVGVTDDKVVISTNQWDLNTTDCLGDPYEGARIRVIDWADLTDGGSITVRDITPASATTYFNWVPATNVPTEASSTAGTTAHLVGDKFVNGEWGYVVDATVTGSAKSGTAKLATNEDLTSAGIVSQSFAPPDTIAAFPSGNGFQDERIVSASYRNGRLWFSSNASCHLPEDTAFRACARYVLLDTTTTPASKVESAVLTDVERDTFLPMVGFSRDGSAYFAMSASSAIAHAPIDEYATYRLGGAPLVGGDAEEPVWHGSQPNSQAYFGSRGSIVPMPNDPRLVMALYPATQDLYQSSPWSTQLGGGVTGDPGGSITQLDNGTGWVRTSSIYAVLRPLSTSPIQVLRISGSSETEDTAGGARLVHGIDLPSSARIFQYDMTSAELGGTAGSTVTLYAQWQTEDGTWSAPVSATDDIDDTPPTVTLTGLGLTTGTVGSTAPAKLTWTASDTPSGLALLLYSQNCPGGGTTTELAVTTTTITARVPLGKACQLAVGAVDKADNGLSWSLDGFRLTSIASSPALGFAKTWTKVSSSKYLGGSARYATAAGATASYSFFGRAIGFVTTKGPTRGKAEVWIDGVKVATLDLKASSTRYRQLVFQRSWVDAGPHTIKIKVLGTAGRPRVDFDGFIRATVDQPTP